MQYLTNLAEEIPSVRELKEKYAVPRVQVVMYLAEEIPSVRELKEVAGVCVRRWRVEPLQKKSQVLGN